MPLSAKIKSLEGMRGLCALLVVLGHVLVPLQARAFAHEHSVFGTIITIFDGVGSPAVLVFFVLSGFVMAHRYQSAFDGPALREYLWRRWLRLWPIMLIAIGLAVAAEGGASPRVVLGNLFFLQGLLVPTLPGDMPLWTLTYEVIYYLIFGLVMRGFLPRGTMLCLAVIGLVAAWFSPWTILSILACGIFWWSGFWLARHERRSTWLTPILEGNTSLRAAGLLTLGVAYHASSVLNPAARLAGASQPILMNDVLGALLYLAIVCETLGYRMLRARWFWLGVSLTCLVRIVYQWNDADSGVTSRRWHCLGELGLAFGLLIAGRGRWPGVHLGRLSFLGSISYALYLLHWPIGQMAWSLADKLATSAQKALLVISGYLALFVAAWVLERYYQKAWNRAFARLTPTKSAASLPRRLL